MCMVKGQATTLGFTAYLEKPVDEANAVCVDAILDGGAVIYCKTNVPQGLIVRRCLNLGHLCRRG